MESQLDVLLVDDNPIDLLFFGRAVGKTRLNIRLQTLNSAQQAIDYLGAKGQYRNRSKFPSPDVIVLDLEMPQLNGFDFLAWRKSSGLFLSIPVVVFSGSFQPALLRKLSDLGANKQILKPTDLEDWEKVVREVWDFAAQKTRSVPAKTNQTKRHCGC